MQRQIPCDGDVVALSFISLEYVRDGADDDSLAQIVADRHEAAAVDGLGTNMKSEEARLIERVACREAISMLIDHIDDVRPTRAIRVDGNRRIIVPLGYLCLDLLISMSIGESLIFDHEDVSEVRPEYWFPPDVLAQPEAGRVMARVKRAWVQAKAAGVLKFHYGYGYWRE